MSFEAPDRSAADAGVPAIEVRALGKAYNVYARPHDRLRQALLGRLHRLAAPASRRAGLDLRAPTLCRQFWALRNVSFDVARGETVGIVGRNGSGKSTLLQLICGTLQPSEGTVLVSGRIAALLELGAGFNAEFTGRENVYMNGALLGLRAEEIEARFDDILAFSEIGAFIDQPVKTYSSGMYLRLAFSVAINVDPDILVVDEALAVGDMLFQAKCMIRLKQLMERGKTVLFVSHDVATVKALCQRCVWLDEGSMVACGPARDVVEGYVSKMHMQASEVLQEAAGALDTQFAAVQPIVTQPPAPADPTEGLPTSAQRARVSVSSPMQLPEGARRYGDGRARLLDVKLLDAQGDPVDQLELDAVFHIQAAVRFDAELPTFAFGYSMRDLKGQMLVGAISSGRVAPNRPVSAGDVFILEIASRNPLAQGVYTVTVSVELPVLLNRQHIFLDVIEHAVVFRSVFPGDPALWFPAMVQVPARFTAIQQPKTRQVASTELKTT